MGFRKHLPEEDINKGLAFDADVSAADRKAIAKAQGLAAKAGGKLAVASAKDNKKRGKGGE